MVKRKKTTTTTTTTTTMLFNKEEDKKKERRHEDLYTKVKREINERRKKQKEKEKEKKRKSLCFPGDYLGRSCCGNSVTAAPTSAAIPATATALAVRDTAAIASPRVPAGRKR